MEEKDNHKREMRGESGEREGRDIRECQSESVSVPDFTTRSLKKMLSGPRMI